MIKLAGTDFGAQSNQDFPILGASQTDLIWGGGPVLCSFHEQLDITGFCLANKAKLTATSVQRSRPMHTGRCAYCRFEWDTPSWRTPRGRSGRLRLPSDRETLAA